MYETSKDEQKGRANAATAFLMASVLGLGVVGVQQQMAYAQSGEGVTVTAGCFINDEDVLDLEISAEGERAGFIYQTSVFNSDGLQLQHVSDVIQTGGRGTETFLEFGRTYTVEVAEAPDGHDFLRDPVEPFETIEISCPEEPPDLTEMFPNQGECITEANTNPDAGFTKDDCKDAFKTK